MGTRNIQNIICATTFREHSTYPNSVLPISKQKKKKKEDRENDLSWSTIYIYARVCVCACILLLDRSVAGTKSVYKSRGICASKPNGKNETKKRKQKRGEKRKRIKHIKTCIQYRYTCHAIKFECRPSAFTARFQKTTILARKDAPARKYNMIYLLGADRNSAMLHSLLTTNDISNSTYRQFPRILNICDTIGDLALQIWRPTKLPRDSYLDFISSVFTSEKTHWRAKVFGYLYYEYIVLDEIFFVLGILLAL